MSSESILTKKKLMTALPDALPGLRKLIKFDTERSAFYKEEAVNQYQILQHVVETDSVKVDKLQNAIDGFKSKIADLASKIQSLTRATLNKIRRIQEKDEGVMKQLA